MTVGSAVGPGRLCARVEVGGMARSAPSAPRLEAAGASVQGGDYW